MVQSLIEHGEIRTTIIKAKEMRPLAEKVVQLAVDAAIATEAGDKVKAYALRLRAIQILNDRQIIPAEHREAYDAMDPKERGKVLRARTGRRYRASVELPGGKFTSESVIHRLFAKIGPTMKSRNEAKGCCGGYTRVIKLADRRLGDGGRIGILQLVGEQDEARKKGSSKTDRSRKAKIRYAAFAGKAVQRRGKAKATKSAEAAPASEESAE